MFLLLQVEHFLSIKESIVSQANILEVDLFRRVGATTINQNFTCYLFQTCFEAVYGLIIHGHYFTAPFHNSTIPPFHHFTWCSGSLGKSPFLSWVSGGGSSMVAILLPPSTAPAPGCRESGVSSVRCQVSGARCVRSGQAPDHRPPVPADQPPGPVIPTEQH